MLRESEHLICTNLLDTKRKSDSYNLNTTKAGQGTDILQHFSIFNMIQMGNKKAYNCIIINHVIPY